MHDDQDKKKTVLEQLLKFVEEDHLNIDLVTAIAGDRELSPGEQKHVERLARKRGRQFYSDLLFVVTYKYFPYEEAESIWNRILDHKKSLNERLGRNVGITVAALDYLTNIRDAIPDAGIIPGSSLEEIAETAVKDGLTRLFDKSTLESLLAKEVQRFVRYGNQLSLAMIDIDDFKKINDTHGHPKGDEVLSRLGDLIDRETRDVDLAGRYGGEEFMIVFPQTTLEEAVDIADRFRTRVETEFHNDVPVTVSIGVANCPDQAKDTKMLITSADKALYEAKRQGKNRVLRAKARPGTSAIDCGPAS